MDLDLPKEVLAKLPEPGSDGIIRATVGLKMEADGGVELVELNDTPLPTDDEESEDDSGDSGEGDDEASDDQSPSASLSSMADQLYGRGSQ